MRIFCLFVLMICLSSTLAHIHIRQPKYLRNKIHDSNGKKGEIDYSISTFGYLDYQSKINLVLKKWDDDTGCNQPSTKIIDYKKIPEAFIMYRGGCNYLQKAQNVHLAGGRLAIVILNDETETPELTIPIESVDPKSNLPPLIIISKNNGEELMKAIDRLKPGKSIILNVNFDMKRYSKIPLNMNIWFNPLSEKSYLFFIDFIPYFEQLSRIMELTLTHKIGNSNTFSYTKSKNNKRIKKYCYLKGKYCVGDEAYQLANPKSLIKEGLIFKCLFKEAIAQKEFDYLIDYITEIKDSCLDTDDILACTQDIRKTFGKETILQIMSEEEIQACMKSKFKKSVRLDGSKYIKELDHEYLDSLIINFKRTPSVFIEGELVRGKTEADIVAGAFCDSLKHRPKECRVIHNSLRKKIAHVLDYNPGGMGKVVKSVFYVLLVVSGIVLLVLTLLLFKRISINQMSDDLDSRIEYSLSQYHRVKDVTNDSNNEDEDSVLKPSNV